MLLLTHRPWTLGMLINKSGRPADRVDHVTNHLGAQLRELLAKALVGQVVKGHTVPAAAAADHGRERVARKRKEGLQVAQLPLLRLRHPELDEYDSFHGERL